ncbi:MAG: DUF4185 domain-containing protein [Deltaproteobacteria bacterium]|nr:DUF4185 domain-containing protein [Deltaproteobacteria bacterium]
MTHCIGNVYLSNRFCRCDPRFLHLILVGAGVLAGPGTEDNPAPRATIPPRKGYHLSESELISLLATTRLRQLPPWKRMDSDERHLRYGSSRSIETTVISLIMTANVVSHPRLTIRVRKMLWRKPDRDWAVVLLLAELLCFMDLGFVEGGASGPAFDVTPEGPAVKVEQIVGEYDRERREPTRNRTLSRFGLLGTDLGAPFRHKDRTYLLFGDTAGIRGGDAIAYSTSTNLENGLQLNFIQDEKGNYKPVTIPGISQGGFEVPMEGVSVADRMYVYHTTDHRPTATMGRSVVARSDDDGHTFRYLYDLSVSHFINVSIVKVNSAQWKGLPWSQGEGLIMFGSGTYRTSDVRLAFQPASRIERPASIRYFRGLDREGRPQWSSREADAVALFHQPCVGELSVAYNKFIRKWIMLYNCGAGPLGINVRTADMPWGPWSEPQEVFHPARDAAFCRFIHGGWEAERCDLLHDPGRENVKGDGYGPYQFEDFSTGDENRTTIYFTLSTWNPYTVVLMRLSLRRTAATNPG